MQDIVAQKQDIEGKGKGKYKFCRNNK